MKREMGQVARSRRSGHTGWLGRAPLLWVGLAALALSAAACSSAARPTPQIVYVSPVPTPYVAPVYMPATPELGAAVTPFPIQSTEVQAPIFTSAPASPVQIQSLVGQDAVTAIALADGSLGMTVTEFIARYNANLDQGQYPITDQPTPEPDSAQVSLVTPAGATNTRFLFIANTDGTLRSIAVISTAKAKGNDLVGEEIAEAESVTVWATAGVAANPALTVDEGNNLLGTIGFEVGKHFGNYAVSTDVYGVRYAIIETTTATDLIIREAN